MPEEKIAELNTMLNAVVTNGHRPARLPRLSRRKAARPAPTRPIATPGIIGFTGHYVTGVWFGNDDFTEMNKMTGGTVPAATWHDFMVEALAGKAPVALAGLPVEEFAYQARRGQPEAGGPDRLGG